MEIREEARKKKAAQVENCIMNMNREYPRNLARMYLMLIV